MPSGDVQGLRGDALLVTKHIKFPMLSRLEKGFHLLLQTDLV